MMSVLEYALDTNRTAEEILAECRKLNIDVKRKEDILDDEAITLLDANLTANNNSSDNDELTEDVEPDYEENLDSIVGGILTKSNIKTSVESTKQKSKKKPEDSGLEKDNFNQKRKAMYKNKETLMSNCKEEDNIVLYKDNMSVSEFAVNLGIKGTELIKTLMALGIMSSLNQAISFEHAEIIALEYNKQLKREETRDEANFEEFEINDRSEDLIERPPVVTIMGHVDHGKTTLLDTIRKANVVDSEAGGITQHIGAYQVLHNDKKITFIDTPGHAAFTEMRARGASITDIVIIIVSADDGIMPQTKEAIDHARAAKVPIIIAINKIDKPGVNIERVLTGLNEYGIVPEEWGGDTLVNRISAKSGEGIDALLENIVLISEMAELKANPNRYALGTVIESRLDKNIGAITTLLIQNGTLRLGDPVVIGTLFGKVRTLKNDLGMDIVEATPSMPVEITGLSEVPSAGSKFMAFETDKKARLILAERIEKSRQKSTEDILPVTLEDLFSKIESGIKEINVILKADVHGSAEAVRSSLEKIEVAGARVNVIRSGVGTVTESDVVLANASNAIIIGFNVRPASKTIEMAKQYSVDIRLYNIIYKVVEEIQAAMKGMLDPQFEEKIIGEAEVRKIFKFSKIGIIAGSHVTSGLMKRDSNIRIIRDGIVVYTGKINSIQREKDTVKEIKSGFECGITVDNFNDIKEKDIIEAYEIIEIK
jgi:translation initiation factor IF-2